MTVEQRQPISRNLIDKGWDHGVQPNKTDAGMVYESTELKPKTRLRLEIRTPTDVDWFTINTAEWSLGNVRKLRNLWYDGYEGMYPTGTEWRVRKDVF